MVYILLAPGFEEAEALVPADMLRRANVETALVSLEGESVTGGRGITVQTGLTLDQVDLDQAEMVVLPGGGVGVQNLGEDARVEAMVREAVLRDLWVAAICAAPTLLGRWGLLEGREAVCYPGMEGQLTGAKPQMDLRVVMDGKIITGRAAGSAFDFGLTLVAALRGVEEAEKVQNGIWY